MHHDLKIAPAYFKAVIEGRKTFEIRKDDRGFQAGDTVTLLEYDDGSLGRYVPPSDRFTGAKHDATIGYVTAFEQKPGYVVFSLLNTN